MKISVIGLGKLGSPLLAVLASKGHTVIGVDINREFVQKINNGISPVEEPGLQELISANRERIRATLDYDEAILSTDVTFVIVPTPSLPNGHFSNQYILDAMHKIGASLAKKTSSHVVSISSTVMPGSTGGEIQKTLLTAAKKTDIGLCYSPEFIALGSVIKNMLFPDFVLIGESDRRAGDVIESIYNSVCENHPPIRRMNFVNAEITKIGVNTFVTTKISFANMLSDFCQRIEGGDVDVVTNAIGLDRRVGAKYLKGAVAFGGPCFPRDNIALAAFGKEIGARSDLALATQEINRYQIERLQELIRCHSQGNRIGILGLSYKPDTYVVDESPGVAIANHLSHSGYTVTVYDPMALNVAEKVLNMDIVSARSMQECIQASDTLLIMTAWPQFVKEITPDLVKNSVVIDCWRILPPAQFPHVIYLGYGVVCKEMIEL